MTRVQYFTATSADGFIADEDHSLEWLFQVPHDEDDDTWEPFIEDVGVLAMGASTYEWMAARYDMYADDGSRWRDFYGDRPAWVFTHRDLPPLPGVDLHFASGDVRPAHAAMVAAAGGRNIWLLGGGDLVGQFDDAGLLDEVLLGLTPVFLGSGAPLLPRRITADRCTLVDARRIGQRVRVTLAVGPRATGQS